MIRTIITPADTNINLSVPEDYVGKPIEVTFVALDELQQKPAKKTMADFWGVISNETAKTLYQRAEESGNEWNNNI